MVLLANVTLLVRIKYGSAEITRITTKPYKVSLALLIVMITETIGYLICSDTVYNGDFLQFKHDILDTWYSTVFFRALAYTRVTLLLKFILCKAFENQILHLFMLFQ